MGRPSLDLGLCSGVQVVVLVIAFWVLYIYAFTQIRGHNEMMTYEEEERVADIKGQS